MARLVWNSPSHHRHGHVQGVHNGRGGHQVHDCHCEASQWVPVGKGGAKWMSSSTHQQYLWKLGKSRQILFFTIFDGSFHAQWLRYIHGNQTTLHCGNKMEHKWLILMSMNTSTGSSWAWINAWNIHSKKEPQFSKHRANIPNLNHITALQDYNGRFRQKSLESNRGNVHLHVICMIWIG